MLDEDDDEDEEVKSADSSSAGKISHGSCVLIVLLWYVTLFLLFAVVLRS